GAAAAGPWRPPWVRRGSSSRTGPSRGPAATTRKTDWNPGQYVPKIRNLKRPAGQGVRPASSATGGVRRVVAEERADDQLDVLAQPHGPAGAVAVALQLARGPVEPVRHRERLEPLGVDVEPQPFAVGARRVVPT